VPNSKRYPFGMSNGQKGGAMRSGLVFVLSLLAVPAAQAQLREEKTVTLALALEAATAAVDECRSKGFSATATVVDRAGHVKATIRADGAGPASLESAQRKAWTSAAFRVKTSDMAENAQKTPANANIWQIPGVILLAGGLPIRAGSEVVGAIGVGGAPGGTIDEECANAGINKINDRLK
jgi:uncharacterized protein GlcG (DUF336 family)